MQSVRNSKHLLYLGKREISSVFVPVWYQYPKGYDNKWDGEELRKIRAKKGVGNGKKVTKT